MQFKRMVAGISAAAIAVTQTAIVPIDIFAATNKPVDTSDIGFSLKLTSKNQTGNFYDGDYVLAAAKKAILNAEKIQADGANTDLAFSYGGEIPSDAPKNIGDQYTFTAQGLNITATPKGSSTPESSKLLWSGSDDLDEVLEAGVIDIPGAGSAGDIITINYSTAEGCAIKLTDSEGNEITPDSDENEILTFKLTDKSASLFHIMGDKVFVNSVDVTSINELTKDILYTIGTLTMNTNVPSGSAAGDTAILYYTDVEPEAGVPEDIAVEGAADGVNENGTYTFTLTEDMVKNGLTVSGNGHRISSCTVKHKKTTDLGIRGPIDDIKSSATVDAAQFADAAANNSLKITFTVNADKTNPEFIVASGHSNLSRAVPSADDAYHTFLLDESAVNSIKENGISISGNDVTITGVELVTPQTDVPAESVTLFSSDEPVVWSQTWMDGYWDGEQAIDTTSISDSIGTIDAFNQNYDNITATWVSLSATKLVLDEGELWVGENTLGNWGSWVSVGKTDVKKGGKIIVAYKDAKNAQIMLKKSDYTEFAGSPGSASNIKNGKGTVTFDLDEAAAAEISANGFVLGGKDASVTSVKYEAPAETKIAIDTKNFPDANFRNLLKTYSTDGKTLSESDIAKITELGIDVAEHAALANVTKFDGIEYLTALETLSIGEYSTAKANTKITALDLSQNDSLIQLDAGHCTKLASVKLPADITTVHLSSTAISELDTSAMTELLELAVSGTKLTSLDVSKNTKLENLSIVYTGINSIDLTANTELKELYVSGCDLTKLDVSKNTKLLTLFAGNCNLTSLDVSNNTELTWLNVSKNHLTSLDLTGLDNLNQLYVDGNVRNIGTVVDGEFDLSTVIDDFDVSKVSDVVGAEMDENGKLTGITGKVTYAYSSGNSINIYDKIIFTLEPEKLVTVYFYVGKMDSDEEDDLVPFEKWDDVVKYINTANDSKASYVIGVDKDVTIDKFTFPAASKAKEIYISSYGESTQTITTKAATIALPTTVGFTDINVKSTAKTFTMSASKDLALDNAETNLTAIKGAAKSTLTLDCPHASISDITADVSGFGTIQADGTTKFSNTVKATNLVLGSGSTVYFTNTASATFTNIKSEEKSNPGYIQYIKNDDGYKQITVTGEILNPVYIGLADEEGRLLPFAEKDTVLTAKTADFTNILITGGAPEGTTLARVGSDIKVLAEKLKVVTLYEGGMNETVYAQWSDVLSTIAANAKAGQKDNEYHVTLLDNYNMNGAFKMPAAKTYSSLNFSSEQSVKTITFTGNITLTGFTIFNNIKLDAQKKSGKEFKPTDFTIAAGKNSLHLEYVKANIKSITSSDEVELTGVTVGAVNAKSVRIWANDENGMLSYAAMGAAWDGKAAPTTTVNITGNLTVKKLLELENNSSLSVGGIINAGEIFALDDTVLVVKQQAKGKNALVIGKSGFDNGSGKINFVLVDPKTEKTAEITEDLILGTIAGPYADQLVPSNDNLTEADSYYIIKSGKNLIAKPKKTAGLVTVLVNRKAAHYKSLDDAIKDINEIGTKTTDCVIKLTPEMFEGKTLAKLPLPNAGKYDHLYYSAESDVTINVTSDLALTGNLTLSNKITLNKVDKNDGSVQPINISLGKYGLTIFNVISADHSNGEEFAPSSMIGNITGTGSINMNGNIVISGKVAKTVTFYAQDASIILEGAMSAFEGTITAPSSSSTAIFTYDKSNAKNVKFQEISGFKKFTLAYRGDDEIAEGDIIASIAGDYSDKNTVTAGSTELVVVRSGNNLKAVNKNNVLRVVEYSGSPFGDDVPEVVAARSYDTFANAVKDIERLKNPSGVYSISAKDGNELVLPKAKTYDTLIVKGSTKVTDPDAEATLDTITTAKDLTLTGNLVLMNINLDKVVRGAVQPMSINLGNYKFMAYNCHISYDADKKVSRLTNINGVKGTFGLMDNMTVSGKVNVGTFIANSVVTFGEKAGFAAATEIIVGEGFDGNDPEFIYPLKAAKNIDLSNIDTGKGFDITVEGAKEGDQVAAVKGDMIRHDIKLNDEEFIIVRSGNKLIAAKDDTEYTLYAPDQSIRLFDTYDNAVAYITKLNNANGIYELTLPQSADNIELKKLTLPTKGKYSGLSITASNTGGTTIIVNSDIALTGDLALKGDLTLMKDGEKLLKITSPLDSKTKKPLYQFTLVDYANVVNGTFNGVSLDIQKGVVKAELPFEDENGLDLAKNVLKFEATEAIMNDIIKVTLKENVASSIVFYDADGNKLGEAAPSEGSVVYFTLTPDQAAKITEGGFTVGGTEGLVTAVTHIYSN